MMGLCMLPGVALLSPYIHKRYTQIIPFTMDVGHSPMVCIEEKKKEKKTEIYTLFLFSLSLCLLARLNGKKRILPGRGVCVSACGSKVVEYERPSRNE